MHARNLNFRTGRDMKWTRDCLWEVYSSIGRTFHTLSLEAESFVQLCRRTLRETHLEDKIAQFRTEKDGAYFKLV